MLTCIGTHSSDENGASNAGGSTPTMVYGVPSRSIARPIGAGSLAKKSLPERMADESHCRTARPVFIGREQPARDGLHAERRQVGCRHRRGHHAFRFTLTHQMEPPLRRQPGRSERPGLVPAESLVEEGSAERIETFAQRHPEDEAVDVREWQRAQEQ